MFEIMQFRFAGERKYLHSTDLYQACAEVVRRHYRAFSLQRVSLKMTKVTQRNVIASTDPLDSDLTPIGEFSVGVPEVKLRLYEDAIRISGSHLYYEGAIQDAAYVARKSVMLSENVPFSDVQVLVALNKLLLTEIAPPKHYESWAFTKMTASLYTDYTDYYEHPVLIKFRQRRRTVYISEYNIGGLSSGEIWFNKVPWKLSHMKDLPEKTP